LSSFPSQPSSVARSAVNADLADSSSSCGSQNLVKFNAPKTQFLPISLSTTPSNNDILFEDNVMQPLNSNNILGINITSNLSWRQHLPEIAKSASKKLGVLFRCCKFFSPEHLLQLYVGFICPCIENFSYIWGGSLSVLFWQG